MPIVTIVLVERVRTFSYLIIFCFFTDLAPNQLLIDLEKTLIQSTATIDCQSSNVQLTKSDSIYSTEPNSYQINRKDKPTTTSISPSCEILKSSFISSSNSAGNSNEKVVINDARPFSALYDIICKEKEIENIMSNAQQTEQLLEKLSHLTMGLTDQNGSDHRSDGSVKGDLINSETEQLLDRTNHSQSTSQNSKFTVAYKNRTESESDCNNREDPLVLGGVADCIPVELDER